MYHFENSKTPCSKNVQPYLSFATQDRQEDKTSLMKQTVNSKEKTHTSQDITWIEGRTTHWETQDTHEGRTEGDITAERRAYILTRSPSLSV